MTHLLILVTVSRLFGRLAKSLGYLEIIGEILAGLLLGPALLGVLQPSLELTGIVELGVFLLIFSAGLEIELHGIIEALKRKSLFIAISGFLVAFLAGVGIGSAFSLGFSQSVCIGLCMAITALPVVARFLSEANLLATEIGHNVMGATSVIDVVALMVLGIVFDTTNINNFKDLFITVGVTGLKMIAFFSLILVVNKVLRSEMSHVQRTERLFKKLIERLGEEAIFGIGVFFVLIFSTASEGLGFHFIVGAFFGGLLLDKDIIGEDYFKQLSHTLGSISNGFLTPVFFAYIGLQFSTAAFDQVYLMLSILAGGYIFKIFGSYAGARLAGFDNPAAVKIGIVLNSRGVSDLVVADLAYEKGYINASVFSILVILGISTIVVNPFLYKKFARDNSSEPESEPLTEGSQ